MNQYSQLLLYIKQLAEQDDYINTIKQGIESEKELDKMDIYPLVNIDIDSGSFPNNVVSFSVGLSCVDIRDVNKEIVNDKFANNDNQIDNHNNTLAALNRMWLIMNRDFNSNNITASENPTITKITFAGKNTVDGWEMSFDVQLPNTTLSLCEGC